MQMSSKNVAGTLVAIVVGVLAHSSAATTAVELPDWSAVSDVETVEVLTTDEDGSARETTVWLLVRHGQGYVRTGDTSWGANVVRTGELTLRIGELEYPVRVEFVEDETLRGKLTEGFREKYGWSDALIGWIRGSHPKLMHLVPR